MVSECAVAKAPGPGQEKNFETQGWLHHECQSTKLFYKFFKNNAG